MSPDLVLLAVLVGAANWCFRVLPMVLPIAKTGGDGPVGRFLSATGPAAIATLFVASILPEVQGGVLHLNLIAGVAAVCGVFAMSRSVAIATIAGAVAYGVATGFSL